MIPIKQIRKLPDFDWMDIARFEMLEAAGEVVSASDTMWQLGNAAVCGFVWNSFTSPPWMWFALSKGVTMKDLVDFRRMACRIPRGTLTAVKDDFEVGAKFAKFYGFKPTGQNVWTAKAVYNIYIKES